MQRKGNVKHFAVFPSSCFLPSPFNRRVLINITVSACSIRCVAGSHLSCLRSQVPCFSTPAAGFRRSMRLCRRKSHLSQLRAKVSGASNCYGAVGAPYEEVVRYQRHPADKHRLIVLVGMSPWAGLPHPQGGFPGFSSLAFLVVKGGPFVDLHIQTFLKNNEAWFLCVFINKTLSIITLLSLIECSMPCCI